MTGAKRDYSLTGEESRKAVEKGLVGAQWYRSDVSRPRLKALMQRRDGPAIRDTAIWFGLLVGAGFGGYVFWGSGWCVPFFFVYGVIWGSSSDSRWHECSHGTAFRTRWMNETLYQVASFMIMREPTVWRWSHARHHTDTIIVGRDPEIVVTRPPGVAAVLLDFFALKSVPVAIGRLVLHASGRMTRDEVTYVPEAERPKVFAVARVWLVIHGAVIVAAIHAASWLPLMYVGLATMYGGWLSHLFGLLQHAGLAEDVLDHRLNSRTVYMNRLFRYLYWNMNYHVEHHMYPMVPYHALPDLHREILADMPKPAAGIIEAGREIATALLAQLKDPEWLPARPLPATANPYRAGKRDATATNP